MTETYQAESNPFLPANPAERGAPAEAIISRQAQEVQAAMVVAKRFPRDEATAYARIMNACKRKLLAENAEYEFPRGGAKVNGPSIRLAEVLAQNWGNIDYGILELENKNGESNVMAYCWDLETNTRRQMVFTVKHERKAGGTIKRLDDPRDIYEMVANQGARRVRACILGIIPGDVVDAALDQCKKTLIEGEKEPLTDRIRKMIVAFNDEHQVTQAMLEKLVGCKVEAFSMNDFLRLRNVFKTLKDGMAKREDFFEVTRVAPDETPTSKTEEAFKQQKQQKQTKTKETAPTAQDGGDQNGNADAAGSDAGADEQELSFE